MNIIEDDRPRRRGKYDESSSALDCSSEVLPQEVVPQRLASISSVVKPVAMKVLRPIPQRVSEQFYDEAYEEGLTNQETSRAAVMAHEWHRKWTQQEESHHAQVDQDFYEEDSRLPSHYDVDRQGASNPFLLSSSDDSGVDADVVKRVREDVVDDTSPIVSSVEEFRMDQLLLNPEDRLSSPSWSNTMESTISSGLSPQVKRRNISAVVQFESEEIQLFRAPVPVRPMAVRPVAVRASLPMDIPPAHELSHGIVPKNVTTVREIESVSPVSFSSETPNLDNELATAILERQDEEVHLIEDDDESLSSEGVASARDGILHALAATKGDVDSEMFKKALDSLLKYFPSDKLDSRLHLSTDVNVEGMWLQLSKPSYFGCLGDNDRGDPMYTLGRMAFDMFSPTNLVCSLQGNFNPVEIVDSEQRKTILGQVPKGLLEEVEGGTTILRTYHVVTAFTIEPNSASFPNAPNRDVVRPIKGIMTTFGYSLPDPDVPNRHSIWFTGGSMEPNNNPTDIAAWKELFTLHPPKHTFGEKAKLLAVKLLMGATVPEGMDEDGRMDFAFTRPLGGHNKAYVDVIYLDETLRLVRGHRGTIMAFSRLKK